MKNISQQFSNSTYTLILIFIVATFGLLITKNYFVLKNDLKKIEEQFINKEKNIVKTGVESVISDTNLDLMNAQILERQEILNADFRDNNIILGIIALLISLITVFITQKMKVQIDRNFNSFLKHYKNAELAEELIDTSVLSFDEFKTVADAANKMITQQIEDKKELVAKDAELEKHQEELEEKIKIGTEEAIELHKQLNHSEKMKAIGTLTGGIAHDFNNILMAISGFSEMALMNLDEEDEVADDIRQIKIATKRASGLVSQILQFSRKEDTENAPLQLNSLVKEVSKLISSTFPPTIKIHHKIISNSFVISNPTSIHQILLNLATNAKHAMDDKGELTITLEDIKIDSQNLFISRDLSEGDYVLLSISDTGTGIPTEIMDKIFEAFFTTKENGKGTGLGLSTINAIMKENNGAIVIDSEIGKGTTFKLFFPVAEMNNKEIFDPSKITVMRKFEGPAMVVDENEELFDIYKENLTAMGIDVDFFSSPIDALREFKIHHYNYKLVISDMNIPHMNGLELINAFRAIDPDFPVVICSDSNDLVSKENTKDFKLDGFISKPIKVEELKVVIGNACAKSFSSLRPKTKRFKRIQNL